MNPDLKTEQWANLHLRDPGLYQLGVVDKSHFEKHMQTAFFRKVEALAARYGKVANILEAGCGMGMDAVCLALRGHHVTGLDVSDHMLRQAHILQEKAMEYWPEKNLDLAWIKGDIFDLSSFDRSFDLVFNFSVLQIWEAPEKRLLILENMRRVLKPGGGICVAGPNSANFLWRLFPPKHLGAEVAEYNIRLLQKEMEAAGFSVEDTDALGLSEEFDQWLSRKWLKYPLMLANRILLTMPRPIRFALAPHILASGALLPSPDFGKGAEND